MASSEFEEYLKQFHRARPGITEQILGSSVSEGITPYEWLTEGQSTTGRVLDLACGSAPTFVEGSQQGWFGIDRSLDELRLAIDRGASQLLVADARSLPFADSSFHSFLCSMALMLFTPMSQALSELRRVLTPEGQGALLLPGVRPFTLEDVIIYSRIKLAVRKAKFATPPNAGTASLLKALRHQGFQIDAIDRRRFSYRITDPEAAKTFAKSWYLPNTDDKRLANALRTLLKHQGREIGIPLIRLRVSRTNTSPVHPSSL